MLVLYAARVHSNIYNNNDNNNNNIACYGPAHSPPKYGAGHTVCALIFAGFILRAFAISRFRVFKFAVARYSGAEIFAGEIIADIRSESVYHNSIRQLQRCKTCWSRCWIRLKMSSYRMESCIRGFHIYKEVWTHTQPHSLTRSPFPSIAQHRI